MSMALYRNLRYNPSIFTASGPLLRSWNSDRAALSILNALIDIESTLRDAAPWRESNKERLDTPVLIEWYELPQPAEASVDLRSVALGRLAKLSVLLSKGKTSHRLCARPRVSGCRGNQLFSPIRPWSVAIPDGLSPSALPVWLYSLLCQKPLPRNLILLTTLSQRFSLSGTLASRLYTLPKIGFWQPVAKIAAEGLKAGATSKCVKDLACWTGERYRYIHAGLLAGWRLSVCGGLDGLLLNESRFSNLLNFYSIVQIRIR
ncbi:hypothetical protein F4775DRAFT_602849 [Biscogniauxia sp. FL1348]|nr:hypothetical protein F4775DRAFT_602849 [Biscogniauxia sp. FL1348]